MVSRTKIVRVKFINVKQAFEKIDKERSLGKLYQFGIKEI